MRSGVLAGAAGAGAGDAVLSPATAAQRDDYPSSKDEVEAPGHRQAQTLGDHRTDRHAARRSRGRRRAARRRRRRPQAPGRAPRHAALGNPGGRLAVGAGECLASPRRHQSADRAARVTAALTGSGGTDLRGTLLLTSAWLAAGDALSASPAASTGSGSGSSSPCSGPTPTGTSRRPSARRRRSPGQGAPRHPPPPSRPPPLLPPHRRPLTPPSRPSSGAPQLDQLAALKNTTAALERQYRAGQQALERPGRQQRRRR